MGNGTGLIDALQDPAKEHSVERLSLPPGTHVFDEGDAADSLFVIESGLVEITGGTGTPETVAILGPGECLGEQSLLTGQPRSATAITCTEVVLARLGRDEFLALMADSPQIATAVAATLSERLRTTTRLALGRRRGPIIVVSPASGTGSGKGRRPSPLELRQRAGALAKACEDLTGGRAVLLPTVDSSTPDGAVRAARDAPVVVIPWAASPAEPLPTGLVEVADWWIDCELGDAPSGRGPQASSPGHGPRLAVLTGDATDIARVARLVCGRRIGLALGAGSIRGFAHAGVLRVLAERQVPIDFVSGASVGAIAGALYLTTAEPWRFADLALGVRHAIGAGLPSARGWSPQAALSGRRLRAFFANRFGSDTRIEDLPVPFVASATDLDSHEAVHIDRGSLVDAVSASAAVPGIFPPVNVGGRRLTDGGTTDPVPVSALRERGADIVIAVDVMNVASGLLGSGRSALRTPLPAVVANMFIGLDAITRQIGRQSCGAADVVVTPKAARTPWWDVVPARAYEQAGYEAMAAAMPELASRLGATRPVR